MTARMVRIDDEYTAQFDEMVASLKDHIEVVNDPRLKIDPYFYERREELHKLRDDIKSGKEKMYDFEESMDELIRELES